MGVKYEINLCRLRQILVNLLSNAVKFSSKGNIIVRVSGSAPLPDGRVEITFCVSDEGIGISEEAKEALFQPFIQAESSTTRKYVVICPIFLISQGGSGLGLSICKRLSEMMGGRIWFDSKENEGSSFYFTVLSTPVPSTDPIKTRVQLLKDKSFLILNDNEVAKRV